jgi:hypothetical protein
LSIGDFVVVALAREIVIHQSTINNDSTITNREINN